MSNCQPVILLPSHHSCQKMYFLIVSPWNCRIIHATIPNKRLNSPPFDAGEGKVTNSSCPRPFAIATIFKRRSKWRHDSDLTRRKNDGKKWEAMVCWMFVGLVGQCYAKATWNLLMISTKSENIFSFECRMLGWLCHVFFKKHRMEGWTSKCTMILWNL